MTEMKPPSIAAWMLEHLVPGPRNDALAGDLLEEFRKGRGNGWYWRQVASAVFIGLSRELRNHAAVLLFAAAWSMLAPAWLLAITNLEMQFNLNERFARMVWPWSIACDVGLLLAANILFIWAGIVLYLIPRLRAAGMLRARLLAKGVLASFPVLIALWATLVVLPKAFLGQSIDRPAVIPATGGELEHPAPAASAPVIRSGRRPEHCCLTQYLRDGVSAANRRRPYSQARRVGRGPAERHGQP